MQDMPQGQPGQGAPAPQGQGQAPGRASQLLTDTHSNLMELMDLVSKQPAAAEGKAPLQAAIQALQGFAEVMGQGPGGAPQEPKGGAVPMEAGAAKVQPAM